MDRFVDDRDRLPRPSRIWPHGTQAVSGRDISQLPFYVSFAYWKLACILEGVYARYLGGALGQRDAAELEPFKLQVDGAAAKAVDALEAI